MTSYSGNLHSSSSVEISEIEPESPTIGLIWQKISSGEIKIYDGTVFQGLPDQTASILALT